MHNRINLPLYVPAAPTFRIEGGMFWSHIDLGGGQEIVAVYRPSLFIEAHEGARRIIEEFYRPEDPVILEVNR